MNVNKKTSKAPY